MAEISQSASARLVVAMACEARPLQRRFGLRPAMERESPYRLFRRDDIWLVVSGVGLAAAAAATGYLHAASGSMRRAVWLNVGVCGHRDLPPGERLMARRIAHRASARSWDPWFVGPLPCPTDDLWTVDRAEREFVEPGAYDMEAAGFYPTALRFTSPGLAHCFKVVSDGRRSSVERLSAARIEELLEEHLDEVAGLIRGLTAVAVQDDEGVPTGS